MRVADPPAQMAGLLTDTLGKGLTYTVPEAELEQPVTPLVTVTEYVVVLLGETVMEAVVAPPGLHK